MSDMSCSDGDCDMSQVAGSSRASSRASSSSGHHSKVGCSGAFGGGDGGTVCYLCVQTVAAGNDPRFFKGLAFHNDCFAAVRCFRRIQQNAGGRRAVAEADLEMVDEPRKWRQRVTPLRRNKATSQRDASSRFRTVMEAKKRHSFREKGKIDDKLIVNLRRFTSFTTFWDRITVDEAERRFKKLHKRQKGQFDAGKTKQVQIDDISRTRTYTGSRETEAKPMPDAASVSFSRSSSMAMSSMSKPGSCRRQRSPSSSQSRSRSASPAGRGNSPSRSPSSSDPDSQLPAWKRYRVEAPRPRSVASAARDVAGSASDACAAADDQVCRRRRRYSQKTAQPLQDADAAEAAKQASFQTPPKAKQVLDRTKASPLELMKEKAELKASLAKVVAAETGAKSSFKKLAAFMARKIPGFREEDTQDANEAVAECKLLHKTLTSLAEEADRTKTQHMQDFIDKVETHKSKLVAANKKCQEQLDGLTFIENQLVATKRQASNKVRYARKKVANRLVVGTFGKKFAKHVSDLLEDDAAVVADTDPTHFDQTQPALFKDKQTISSAKQMINDMEATSKKGMSAKIQGLTKSLEEHEKWGGAMVQTDVQTTTADFFPGAKDMTMEGLDDAGTVPWLCAMKPFYNRYGPVHTPLPGVGAFVAVRSQNKNMGSVTLLVMPAAELLSKGIALPDAQAFLESPSGEEFTKAHVKLVHLADGDSKSMERLAWIPYGWIMMPLSWGSLQAKENEEQENAEHGPVRDASLGENAASVLWVQTIFSKSLVETIAEPVWQAIVHWNGDHLQQNMGTKPFAARATFFRKFSASRRAAERGTDSQAGDD